MTSSTASRILAATAICAGVVLLPFLEPSERPKPYATDFLRTTPGPQAFVIRSVEGGLQASGYSKGRPVASGSDLPLIIRWEPRADGGRGLDEPPVQAAAIAYR